MVSAELIRRVCERFRETATAELLAAFLLHRQYKRKFALSLLASGRDASRPWEFRRLAALMLQHHILRLPADDLREHDFLLRRLGLKKGHGVDSPMDEAVLREGYTTTRPAAFIAEFRRRLARPDAIFSRLNNASMAGEDIEAFLLYSRLDCRLVLGRYVFTPEEVVRRILEQVRLSRGLKKLVPGDQELINATGERALARMPAYEAEILRLLCEGDRIHWVDEQTSNEINQLVEYPLGTVVLTVKPPGSELEFELKRAGRRGAQPLGVVFTRNDCEVAPSHRLDGGSRAWSLHWEARAASLAARVYRLVHDREAPVSIMHTITTVYGVPTPTGEHHLLSYLSDAEVFGPGYREMRAEMRRSVEAFDEELSDDLATLPGEMGLTARYVHHLSPGSGILSGTSSFRLDRLALYLSAEGAHHYYSTLLKRAVTTDDARAFADTLMEEILGEFKRPAGEFGTYEHYVEAGFAVAENRVRADEAYLKIVEEIARFWGTLLAVRGFSCGESFVARNVGIKSIWREGRWQVQPVFMDHDNLQMPGRDTKHVHQGSTWYGAYRDGKHILGNPKPGANPKGEIPFLQEIYRINQDIAAKGKSSFAATLKESYVRTQQSIVTQPRLRALFHPAYLEHFRNWDKAVVMFFRAEGMKTGRELVKAFLLGRGLSEAQVRQYTGALRTYRNFLEQLLPLFESSPA